MIVTQSIMGRTRESKRILTVAGGKGLFDVQAMSPNRLLTEEQVLVMWTSGSKAGDK